MISFTIATFLRSCEDPYVLQEVQEIIHVLAENEFCIVALQERLVPTLVSSQIYFYIVIIDFFIINLIDFINLGEHFEFRK